MKVVILCGGKGSRLRDETEFRPKPMLPIGERPILWHIMKLYASHGHSEFILCLGYRGDIIRDYFRNYPWNTADATIQLGSGKTRFHNRPDDEDWSVTLAETGEGSATAARVRKVRPHLDTEDTFLLTYGDGVGNVDINRTIAQHKDGGRICTITAVHPPGRFGEVDADERALVRTFNEKPQMESGYVNGGFMVCNKRFFDYLPEEPDAMLETSVLCELAKLGQLGAYRHETFWHPMDTLHDFTVLNELWRKDKAPWKVW